MFFFVGDALFPKVNFINYLTKISKIHCGMKFSKFF